MGLLVSSYKDNFGSPRDLLLGALHIWKVPIIFLSPEKKKQTPEELLLYRGLVEKRLDNFHKAPFKGGGIIWGDNPRIIWFKKSSYRHADLCALIHELAHVLIGVPPANAHETESAMLAIEFAHYEHCGISGSTVEKWMADYGMPSGSDWRNASWQEKVEVLWESREFAIQEGLLSKSGAIRWSGRVRPGGKKKR